jgi:hypothetical protein
MGRTEKRLSRFAKACRRNTGSFRLKVRAIARGTPSDVEFARDDLVAECIGVEAVEVAAADLGPRIHQEIDGLRKKNLRRDLRKLG